jgi:hypothetical protein
MKTCIHFRKNIRIEGKFNAEKQTAGQDCSKSFMELNPGLNPRKAQEISVIRATAMNKKMLTLILNYSGRRITPSFSYVTERGEGEMERARGSKTANSLSEHV